MVSFLNEASKMMHLKSLNFCFKFSFLLILILKTGVKCERIENEVFLKVIRNNSDAFKFYYPNYNNLLTLIDYVLFDESKNISGDCENSLLKLKTGLNDKAEWALKCGFLFKLIYTKLILLNFI